MALSVYIHFPFCIRKCPYCDFSSHAVAGSLIPQRDYTDAVLAEFEWRATRLTAQSLGSRPASIEPQPMRTRRRDRLRNGEDSQRVCEKKQSRDGRRRSTRRDRDLPIEALVSIYIGGGTPSLWEPDELSRVLNAIDSHFGCNHKNLEVTLECNPSSLDRARAEAYRAIGVNRFSIGVQSLDDRHLRYLNRLHDARSALKAVEQAVSVVSRVGVDIIFGLPDQPRETIRQEIVSLVDLGIEHISAYALTVEPNTPFGDLYKQGNLSVAQEEEVAKSFLDIRQTLRGLGFEHYEVSNYAVPGQESRHNQHYWRGNAYLGLGAAAVGCLHTGLGSVRRYRNQADIDSYLATSKGPAVEDFTEQLGPESVTNELLMLGLRTARGVHLPTVQARTGIALSERQDDDWNRLLQRGDLVREGDWLKVPRERWLLLDSIVACAFLAFEQK